MGERRESENEREKERERACTRARERERDSEREKERARESEGEKERDRERARERKREREKKRKREREIEREREPNSMTVSSIDWCWFDFFVRNSLVAFLEALCAQSTHHLVSGRHATMCHMEFPGTHIVCTTIRTHCKASVSLQLWQRSSWDRCNANTFLYLSAYWQTCTRYRFACRNIATRKCQIRISLRKSPWWSRICLTLSGVATISRLLEITGLFCRMSSLL